MLTEIRDRSSGWFSYVIAALIIIPMAFWGVQEYANRDATLSVVQIGEQKISQNEFQVRLSNEQQRLRQTMGAQVNDQILNSDAFKQNVLNQMINRALVQQVAEQQNYRIGNEQLVEVIKDSELFKVDGEFSAEAYDRYLQGSYYSKNRYENELRDGTRLNQVTSGFQDSALVLSEEVRTLLEMQAEQRTFDIVTLKKAEYLDQVSVSDTEIADHYAENQNAFMQAEKMSASYVQLSSEQLQAGIEVDEDELLAQYQQSAESYISEEKRETRHILLSTNGDEDEDAQRALADKLVADLRAGADFAELAKTHSADPGSANAGGSLGIVERGQMVPEFEQATFALEQGAISDPVKSQFGFHIIQVEKIELPQQQPFEEVKDQLLQEEKDRIAEEMLLDRVDQLRDLAYEQPESLDAIGEEMGLEILTTELFDRDTGTGVAASQIFRTAAFAEEVLVDEINSEPIDLGGGSFVVLRRNEYQESKAKPLAAVTAEIKTLLTQQKATAAATQQGQQLLAEAKSDWSALAAREGVEPATHTVSLVSQDRAVSPQVLEHLNGMKLSAGNPSVSSIEDNNGDFHILRLTAVQPGDVNQISQQVKDSTRRLVASRNGNSLMNTYLEALREEAKPLINAELL